MEKKKKKKISKDIGMIDDPLRSYKNVMRIIRDFSRDTSEDSIPPIMENWKTEGGKNFSLDKL